MISEYATLFGATCSRAAILGTGFRPSLAEWRGGWCRLGRHSHAGAWERDRVGTGCPPYGAGAGM